MRSCVACRTTRPQRELLRVVRDPAGHVLVDGTGRTNGRGAYVCRDLDCIQAATGRGLLARALAASVPATLAAELTAITEPSSRGGFIGQE